MTETNVRKIHFEYFDLLPEPFRSQAKKNYCPKMAGSFVPSSIQGAIMGSIPWRKSKEGFEYWEELHLSLSDGWTYCPILPKNTSVFEVACFQGKDIVLRHSEYNGSSWTNLDESLTSYAWRESTEVL